MSCVVFTETVETAEHTLRRQALICPFRHLLVLAVIAWSNFTDK